MTRAFRFVIKFVLLKNRHYQHQVAAMRGKEMFVVD